jgi:hypothetical protein
MQPYKGYLIEGSALVVHPFSADWFVGGGVHVSGPYSSIVEITRFSASPVHGQHKRTRGMVRAEGVSHTRYF